MDCKIASGLLDVYLDGELDRSDARALEAHVDSCAACAAALASADALRRALREPALRHAAPDALRGRIGAAQADAEAATAGTPPPTAAPPTPNVVAFAPRPRRVLPAWLGIAAACLLSFGGGALWMRHDAGTHATAEASTQFSRDLFASHWRALAATSPVDVISSDHHTVKPWFAGKIALSPVVQDFATQGFTLVGGRIDYVGGERVAVLVYRHGAHWIDVYVLPQAVPMAHAQARGYAADAITVGGQPAMMVTDMDAGERAKLAGLLERLQ